MFTAPPDKEKEKEDLRRRHCSSPCLGLITEIPQPPSVLGLMVVVGKMIGHAPAVAMSISLSGQLVTCVIALNQGRLIIILNLLPSLYKLHRVIHPQLLT